MSILIVDVETSDMPSFYHAADHEDQARIVQLGLLLCDDDLEPVERYCQIIKPTGWIIAPGAEAVHGISTQRAMDEGFPIFDAMAVYLGLWKACHTIAGFSVRFDMKFLRGELRRLSEDDRIGQRPVFDAMPHVRQMVGARGAKGQVKAPKLVEAYRFFEPEGTAHTAAHDALVDCEMTRAVMQGFVRRGGKIVGDSTLEFSKSGKEAAAAAKVGAPLPNVSQPILSDDIF